MNTLPLKIKAINIALAIIAGVFLFSGEAFAETPTPNPMVWDVYPHEVYLGYYYGFRMTAKTATDPQGGSVSYYFQCMTEGGFSGGWQSSPTYTVTVGYSGQVHTFRVKAKDASGNETDWSSIQPYGGPYLPVIWTTVSGYIRDQQSKGVNGVKLYIGDVENGPIYITATYKDTIRGDGYYYFKVGTRATYYRCYVVPAHQNYTFNPEYKLFDNGGFTYSFNFSATRLYTISGTLKYDDGQAINGVTVSVGGNAVTTGPPTNPPGVYTLNGVGASSSPWSIIPPSGFKWTPPRYDFTGISGDVLDKDFTASRHSLSGTVRDYSGAGISGATVTATDSSSNPWTSLPTNSSGVYTITNLYNGAYDVNVSAAGHTFAEEPVTIGGFDISGFNFQSYAIYGYVKDGGINDSGIPNAEITITPGSRTTATLSDGYYIISGLAGGDYTVAVTPPPLTDYVFYPSSYTNVTLDAAHISEQRNFHTYTISGQVIDYSTETGVPGGLQVTIEKAGPPPTPVDILTTASDGSYEKRNLEPDNYIVTVETYSGHKFVAEYPAGTYNPDSRSQAVTLGPTPGNGTINFFAVEPPVADFQADATVGSAPFTVNFDSTNSTNHSSGDIASYSWDFGDPGSGASNTSNLANPAHTYNNSDTYTVTLSLTGPLGIVEETGLSTTTKPNYVTVNSPPAAIIDVVGNVTIVTVGDTVEFDANSSNDNGDGGTINWVSSTWTQQGPQWTLVEYKNGNKWNPIFRAPNVATQGTVYTTFTLKVYDNDLPYASSDTADKIIAINRPPDASPSVQNPLAIIPPNTPVVNEGTPDARLLANDTDLDDDTPTYSWSVFDKTWDPLQGEGSDIVIVDPTTATPTFDVPSDITISEDAIVTFQVIVDDGIADPITKSLEVKINRKPDASPSVQNPLAILPMLGGIYVVNEGTPDVGLNTNPTELDPTDTLTYLWSVFSKTWDPLQGEGSDIVIKNPTTDTPTFDVPSDITISGNAVVTFQVIVSDMINDGQGDIILSSTTKILRVKINRSPDASPSVQNPLAILPLLGGIYVVNEGTPDAQLLTNDSDLDPGDTPTYSWSVFSKTWDPLQGEGSDIVIKNPTTDTPTFDVPDDITIQGNAIVTFQVIVSDMINDGQGDIILSSTTKILRVKINRSPDASPSVQSPAGTDSNNRPVVNEGTPDAQLLTNDSDFDGGTPTYSWSVELKTWTPPGEGSDIVIKNPTTATPTFDVPDDITIQGNAIVTFQVIVSDMINDGQADIILSSITKSLEVRINRKPNANPGIPPTVNVGDPNPIDLIGSASGDLDGDTLTYLWEKNAGTYGTLSNVDQEIANYTAPASVTEGNGLIQVEVRLTVTDIYGLPDTVELPEPPFKITINRKPTAVTVIDKTVVNEVGDSVRFDGRTSYDPDEGHINYSTYPNNGIKTYTWTVVQNTYGIDETHLSVNGQEPYPEVAKFTPIEGIQGPGPINVQFELTVVGNTGNAILDSSDPVSTGDITINRRPVASARADRYVVEEGGQVELIGTDSDDPDGDIIEYYYWQETTGLAGVNILNPYSASTMVDFQAGTAAVGSATFTLTVTDIAGGLSHTSGEVEITINAPADILYVGPSRAYTTIQSAIDAASDGYIIQVDRGSYQENITLIDGITLRSAEWQDASDVILPDTTHIEGQVTMANDTKLLGFRISFRFDFTVAPNTTEALVNVDSVSDVTIAYNVIKAKDDSASNTFTLCGLKLEELTTAAAEDMENINIHNNVIQSNAQGTNCIALGLAIIQHETDESFPHNIEIVNNTIDAISAGKAYGLYIDANTASDDTTFESEIIVINDIITIAPSKGVLDMGVPPNYCIYKNEDRDITIPLPPGYDDYDLPVKYSNLYRVKSAFLDPTDEYNGFIDIRPQFNNQLGEDPQYINGDPYLHLYVSPMAPYENSPCIDAGITSGKYADYSSEPPAFSVFVNTAVNMGAYGNTFEAALRREGEAARAIGFNASEEDIPEADNLRLTGSGYDPDGSDKDLIYCWYSEKDGTKTLIGQGDPGVSQLDYDQLIMGSHTLSMRLMDSDGNISKPSKAIPVKVGYPSDLTAAFDGSDFSLSWQDNSTSEDSFVIKRRKSGESTWDPRGSVGGSSAKGAINWSEPAPTDDTYYYKVEAVESTMGAMEAQPEVEAAASPDAGEISSNTAQVKPDIVETPYAPHNLDIRFLTDISFITRIELSWQQDETIPIDYYKIYRSIDDPAALDDLSLLTPDITTATSYYDQDTSIIGTYYYRVVSYNVAGDSTPSDMIEIVRGNNIRPTLKILSPLSGSELVGEVIIGVLAIDPEGDPLLIKLEYKKGDDDWIVIDSFVTSNFYEPYPWDTSVLPRGGDYSLKATAVDINTAPYSEYVVEGLTVDSNNIAVSDIQTLRSALNEANDGDVILLKPGLYTVDEPSVSCVFSSSISVVYSFGLMINKNITLKALNPNPDNTVISLGSRSISIMDPRYYGGRHAYYNTYTHNNGFTNVNDVTIEGITITGTCTGSQTVKVWVPGVPATQTGYGETGYGQEQPPPTGHWAYFTESNITSPIFNFSKKLTLRNCKIPAKSYSGHSVYTWRGGYVNTEVILDNTYLEGDIANDGYMCGDDPGVRYIWLF